MYISTRFVISFINMPSLFENMWFYYILFYISILHENMRFYSKTRRCLQKVRDLTEQYVILFKHIIYFLISGYGDCKPQLVPYNVLAIARDKQVIVDMV